MKSVIIYTYYNSPSSNYNLEFFSKKELSEKPDVDYVIVINGHDCAVVLPELSNLHVIIRPNIGFDFGGHNAALEYLIIENKIYDYYFFMNSGVIGPIVPHYMQNFDWKTAFINKIKNRVKLVGTTIVCLPASDLGGYGPRVEGFCFMVDREGLKLLIIEGTIFCNHIDKVSAIVNGEYGLSRCIFKNGYTIDCMLQKYKNVNWLDINNWNMNNNIHPSRKNSFYGRSIDPYEVIFHKWHWHGKEHVNFDIIKQYVDDYI